MTVGKECVSSGEVTIPGDPLLPATMAIERAHYSYFHSPSDLDGVCVIAKLERSEIEAVRSICEGAARRIEPKLVGYVPTLTDEDAAVIRKDLCESRLT